SASEDARRSISLTSLDILLHSESIVFKQVCAWGSCISVLWTASTFAKITASGDFNSCEAAATKFFWLCRICSVGSKAFRRRNLLIKRMLIRETIQIDKYFGA